jgi:hypothetical protein
MSNFSAKLKGQIPGISWRILFSMDVFHKEQKALAYEGSVMQFNTIFMGDAFLLA